ncbi:LOW QUALITY PROTEIN: tricarboxylate transport protein TctB [Geomicrobium sp. JCM 19038]|nr:LOW QUALITY PROTEIN: tricarboxylate transport protein TctB [Geomicrobium sp. JCM 19038]
MTKLDRWIGISVFIVGVYMILETLTMNYMILMDDPGPVLLPRVVGGALALCGVGLFISGLKVKDKPVEDLPKKKEQEKKMYVILGSLILYAMHFRLLGYMLSTFIFLVATMLYLSKKNTIRHFIQVGVASLGITFLIYWIFTEFLDVILPGGFIG